MKIDQSLILRLEHLARLELQPAERAHLQQDLNRILEMVEKMEGLETANVEPLVYVNEDVNVLREDRVKGQASREAALRNAPQKDGAYFRVPQVIPTKK